MFIKNNKASKRYIVEFSFTRKNGHLKSYNTSLKQEIKFFLKIE